jgi:predicted RNase H-like HicB family nuclease
VQHAYVQQKGNVLNYCYRVGLPGWRTFARAGVPLTVRVFVHHDAESNSYWADSPDLDGLVVTGVTLDEVKVEAESAALALLDLQLHEHPRHVTTNLQLKSALCAA